MLKYETNSKIKDRFCTLSQGRRQYEVRMLNDDTHGRSRQQAKTGFWLAIKSKANAPKKDE